MNIKLPKHLRHDWNRFSIKLVPFVVLFIGLSTTYYLFQASQSAVKQQAQSYFDFRVREVSTLIKQRIQAYEQVLLGTAGLYIASNKVERHEFNQYVNTLNLTHNYPGIQGIGFSLIIPPENKAEHIAKVRREGFPEYTIIPAGKRDIYTSVVYLEPFTGRNVRAFGFDMFSDPVRHAAMIKAMERGEPVLSGKVKLIQETGEQDQSGFLMYVPIYLKGSKTDTLADRRANIVGWTHAAFRMGDLMKGLFGEQAGDLDIHIFDGKTVSSATRMYNSNENFNITEKFDKTIQINFSDTVWTIGIDPLPTMLSRVPTQNAGLIGIFGTIISLVITLLLWSLVSASDRTSSLAKQMNIDLITERKRLNGIIEGTNVGTWEWNVQTGETVFNDRWAYFVGYTLSELSPVSIDTWLKLVHPDDLKMCDALLNKHFNKELDYYECEVRMRHKDGHWVWLLDRGKVIEWTHDGKPLKMSGTHQDISARKQTENDLKIAAAAFESQEGILVSDANKHILRVNRAFTHITGFTETDVVGQTLQLLSMEENDPDLYAQMWQAIHNTGTWAGEVISHRKNGDAYYQELSISAIKDSKGFLSNYIATITDISTRKNLEFELTKQAHLDFLTGLYNRRHFMTQAEVELSRALRNQKPLSLMMLDIDFFKQVNDVHGHQVGDTVLQVLSKICKETLRQVDVIARMGGEEFAVILPETDMSEANEVAERLRLAVANAEVGIPVGLPIHFTVSIGVATLRKKATNIDMLLNDADQALYEAKRTGRNKVCVS